MNSISGSRSILRKTPVAKIPKGAGLTCPQIVNPGVLAMMHQKEHDIYNILDINEVAPLLSISIIRSV